MSTPTKNPNRIQTKNREKALSPWGSRDDRDGYLDYDILNQTEKFFQIKSEQGINFAKYNYIPVQVSEEHPIIQDFRDCEVEVYLLENLLKFGYVRPTPVQRYAIPISLFRKDLMACAQTGSGKTAAYLYPLVAKMLQDGPPPLNESFANRPVSLILAPTRELAIQIYQETLKFVYKTGIICICAYGGTPIEIQAMNIKKGIDILIGTPGRIIDLLERKHLDISIVRYLVLDEADRMLDMGFQPQVIKILEFIKKKERETVMFSATFPDEIQMIAKKYLRDYVFLRIGKVGSTTDSIVQQLHLVNYREKERFLLSSLKSISGKVLSNFYLVFVEKKISTEILKNYLRSEGLACDSIHGDKVQYERERSLKEFKEGNLSILIATDVASRGLDIRNVQYVVIYDLPYNIDQYIHRIGRTGRIGNKGNAIVFVDDLNKPIILQLRKLLEDSNQEIPD